jgi:hypothetical protein
MEPMQPRILGDRLVVPREHGARNQATIYLRNPGSPEVKIEASLDTRGVVNPAVGQDRLHDVFDLGQAREGATVYVNANQGDFNANWELTLGRNRQLLNIAIATRLR